MATQDAVTASTASKMEMLGNNITALGLAFGQGLDPYLNAIVDGLLRFVQAIDPSLAGADALGQVVGGFLANAFLNIGEIIGSVVVPAFMFFMEMLGNWINLFAGVAQAAMQIAAALGGAFTVTKAILVQTFDNILSSWFQTATASLRRSIHRDLSTALSDGWSAGQFFAQALRGAQAGAASSTRLHRVVSAFGRILITLYKARFRRRRRYQCVLTVCLVHVVSSGGVAVQSTASGAASAIPESV